MRPCTPIIIPTPAAYLWSGAFVHGSKIQLRNLEVVTTDSKNGRWEVEVTVSWLAHRVEERMKFGPYQGFVSAPDAQSWAIIRSIEWVDSGNSEPSAFIPLTAPLERRESLIDASNLVTK